MYSAFPGRHTPVSAGESTVDLGGTTTTITTCRYASCPPDCSIPPTDLHTYMSVARVMDGQYKATHNGLWMHCRSTSALGKVSISVPN